MRSACRATGGPRSGGGPILGRSTPRVRGPELRRHDPIGGERCDPKARARRLRTRVSGPSASPEGPDSSATTRGLRPERYDPRAPARALRPERYDPRATTRELRPESYDPRARANPVSRWLWHDPEPLPHWALIESRLGPPLDSRPCTRRHAERRHSDRRHSDRRHSERRHSERRHTERRHSERRSPVAGRRSPTLRTPTRRHADTPRRRDDETTRRRQAERPTRQHADIAPAPTPKPTRRVAPPMRYEGPQSAPPCRPSASARAARSCRRLGARSPRGRASSPPARARARSRRRPRGT